MVSTFFAVFSDSRVIVIMPRTSGSKEINEFTRGQIIQSRNFGLSYRQIAGELKLSPNGVRNIVLKEKNGQHRPADRPGRPPALSEEMQQSLKTTVLANRFITMKELVDQFSVDRKTIIKVLKKFDLNRRVARKVPFLKDDQRERRQIWAQKMNRKTVSFWKRTIFSDEVRFSQFSVP